MSYPADLIASVVFAGATAVVAKSFGVVGAVARTGAGVYTIDVPAIASLDANHCRARVECRGTTDCTARVDYTSATRITVTIQAAGVAADPTQVAVDIYRVSEGV